MDTRNQRIVHWLQGYCTGAGKTAGAWQATSPTPSHPPATSLSTQCPHFFERLARYLTSQTFVSKCVIAGAGSFWRSTSNSLSEADSAQLCHSDTWDAKDEGDSEDDGRGETTRTMALLEQINYS